MYANAVQLGFSSALEIPKVLVSWWYHEFPELFYLPAAWRWIMKYYSEKVGCTGANPKSRESPQKKNRANSCFFFCPNTSSRKKVAIRSDISWSQPRAPWEHHVYHTYLYNGYSTLWLQKYTCGCLQLGPQCPVLLHTEHLGGSPAQQQREGYCLDEWCGRSRAMSWAITRLCYFFPWGLGRIKFCIAMILDRL